MEPFRNQLLTRPALSYHEDRPAHGSRPAGSLHRIQECAGLADELIFPFHAYFIGFYAKGWQSLRYLESRKPSKLSQICRFASLARALLNMGQQQITSREDTMYNRQFFSTTLGKAAIASIAMMTAFVALSAQITVTTPMPMVASISHVEIA